MTVLDLQGLGLCKDAKPEWFFPLDEVGRSPVSRRHIARVKTICQACPVRLACLTDALDLGDVVGIRGGLTGPEREALLRARAEQARAAGAAAEEVEETPAEVPEVVAARRDRAKRKQAEQAGQEVEPWEVAS